METTAPETLTVETLAETLHESNRELLGQVLALLGPERCAALLAETLACEAQGGMLTHDRTRRRTPGGVFFQVVRQRVSARERRRLFPPAIATPLWRTSHAPPPITPLTGDTMQTMSTLTPGDALVKITLIGRPDLRAVRTQPTYVVFRMQDTPPRALPKGLPPVPGQQPITWLVTIALRQWNKVTASLEAHADDKLILEGHGITTKDGAHVLLAQSCTSVAIQRAKKEAQQAAQTRETPS